MGFFRTVRKSIYDVAFYATAKGEPSGKAMKYFALLVLCVAIVTSIPIYASFGMWKSQIGGDIRSRILAVYPDELVLTFKDGRVTSNVDEPYLIPTPKEFVDATSPKNLVVINTSGTITPSDFGRYDTFAILGGDAVWVYDPQKDKTTIQNFDNIKGESFVVNKQIVAEWVNIGLKVGKWIVGVLLIFLPVIIFAVFWCGYLLYLLFGALVIWLAAKLRKVDITYGQAYKLGLYLLTLPIFYSILSSIVMFKLPYVFTLILFAVAYANFGPGKALVVENVELAKKPEPGLPMKTDSSHEPVEPKM